MSVTISSWQFAFLLGLSVVIAISYLIGYRRNLRLIKNVSRQIEQALEPEDKEYTWVGGVIGFSGTFNVAGFAKVNASVFVLPRQSILYYPLSILTAGYDRAEVLFYLSRRVPNEIHAVRKSLWRKPRIYNKAILKEVECDGSHFIIMCRERTSEIEEITALVKKLEPLNLVHLAITPERSIFYIKLRIRPSRISMVQYALRECMAFLETFEAGKSKSGELT